MAWRVDSSLISLSSAACSAFVIALDKESYHLPGILNRGFHVSGRTSTVCNREWSEESNCAGSISNTVGGSVRSGQFIDVKIFLEKCFVG